jgi:hypothetical protein
MLSEDDLEYVYSILDRDFPNRDIEALSMGELHHVLVEAAKLKRLEETVRYDA